jgi:hypothetical protein
MTEISGPSVGNFPRCSDSSVRFFPDSLLRAEWRLRYLVPGCAAKVNGSKRGSPLELALHLQRTVSGDQQIHGVSRADDPMTLHCKPQTGNFGVESTPLGSA